MFLSFIGHSSLLAPSFSLSTGPWLIKFSIALLLTRVGSSTMPLNKCIVIETSSLLETLNLYTVCRYKVLAKAANLNPKKNPNLLPH